MSVDAHALAVRAAEVLASPDGLAALGRAVRAVLARDGAPTRPGGPDWPVAGVLGGELRTRPLGPLGRPPEPRGLRPCEAADR